MTNNILAIRIVLGIYKNIQKIVGNMFRFFVEELSELIFRSLSETYRDLDEKKNKKNKRNNAIF